MTEENRDVDSEVPGQQLSVLPSPAPPETGVPAVDAVLQQLVALASDSGELDHQVAVYEDSQRQLQSALTPGPESEAVEQAEEGSGSPNPPGVGRVSGAH